MANKHQQISIGVDFIANLDKFTQGINNAKGIMSKLDISEQTRKGIDGLAEKMATEITKIKDVASRGKVDIVDVNKINTSMKHIESAYAQMINKIEDMGGDSTFLKNDAKALKALKTGQDNYTKAIVDTEKAQKRLNENLEKAQKAQKEGGKESKKKAVSDADYRALEKSKRDASAKLRAADEKKAIASKKVEEKIANSGGKYSDRESRGFKNTAAYQEEKKAIEEVKTAELELQKIQRQLGETTTFSKQEEEAKKLATNVDNAEKELKDFLNTQKQTASTDAFEKVKKSLLEMKGINWSDAGIDPSQINNIEQLEQAMTKLGTDSVARLQAELPKLNGAMESSGNAIQGARVEIDQAAASAQNLDNKMSQIDSMKQRITYFFGLQNAAMLARRAFTNVFNTVKELDAVMTEAAVVTDFSIGDMWKQLPQYTARANEFGLAIKDVYEADTLFYQQGLKTNEVVALSNETMKMARIAGLDTADATDRMTNALRGFNMELNETNAQNVADVYSELAAISASNVNELSVAMTKTASIASNAGASFENTAAFIAQIVETTRESAETAGTALKTVIARFTELKKDPSEIGEVDGEVVDANKIETALRSVGVALRDSNGEFRDFDDVILELSGKWDSLDVNTQRYIATIAAGSRQQSRFIALMSNNARLTQLTAAANSAAGASQKQYEKTLESLETKLNRLKNAANEFLTTIGNSDVIKGAIDMLTGLLNILNKATSWGPRWIQMFTKMGAAIGLFFGLKKAAEKGLAKIGATMGLQGAKAGNAFVKGYEGATTTGMTKAFAKIEGLTKGKSFKQGIKNIWTQAISGNVVDMAGLKEDTAMLFGRMKNMDNEQKYKEAFNIGKKHGMTDKDAEEFAMSVGRAANAADNLTDEHRKLAIQEKKNNLINQQSTKDEMKELLVNKELTNEKKKEILATKYGVSTETAEAMVNESAALAESGETTENIKAKIAESLETKENYKAAVSEAVERKSNNGAAAQNSINGMFKGKNKTGSLGKNASGEVTSGGIKNRIKNFGTKAGNFLRGPGGYIAAAAAAVAITATIAYGVTAAIDASVETAEEKLENLTKRTELQAEATEQAISRLSESTSLVSDMETMKNEISDLTTGTAEWTSKVFELNSAMNKIISQYGELAREEYMTTSSNGVMSLTEEGQERYLELVQQDALAAQARDLSLKRRQIAAQREAAINGAVDTDAVSAAEESAASTSTWIGGGVGVAGGIGTGIAVAKAGAAAGSLAGPLGALIGGVAGGIIGITAGAIIGESIKAEYNISEKAFEDVINKASEEGFTAKGKTQEEIEQFLSGIDATDSELASLREYLKESGNEFDKLTEKVRELNLQEEANLRQEASIEAQRLGLKRGEKERFEDLYVEDKKENPKEFEALVEKELEAMADQYEVGFDAIFQDWNDTGEFEFDADYIGIYEDFAKEMGWTFDVNNRDNPFIDAEGAAVDMSKWTDAQINAIVAEAKVRDKLNKTLRKEQEIVEDKIRKDPNSIYNLLGSRMGVGKQEWLYALTKEQIEGFNAQLNQVSIQGGDESAYSDALMNIANAAVASGMEMADVMDILAKQSVETKSDFWALKDTLEVAADTQNILGFEIEDTLIEAAIDAADAIGNIDLKKLSEGAETIKELVDKIATSTDKVVTEEELKQLRGLGLRNSQYQIRDDGSAVITDPNWQFGLMRNLEKQSIEDIQNKYGANERLSEKQSILKDKSKYEYQVNSINKFTFEALVEGKVVNEEEVKKYLSNIQQNYGSGWGGAGGYEGKAKNTFSEAYSTQFGKDQLKLEIKKYSKNNNLSWTEDQVESYYNAMGQRLKGWAGYVNGEDGLYALNHMSSNQEIFGDEEISRVIFQNIATNMKNAYLNEKAKEQTVSIEKEQLSLQEIYNNLNSITAESLSSLITKIWNEEVNTTDINAIREMFKKLYEQGTKEALEEAIQTAKNDTEFQSLLEGSWLGQEALNYTRQQNDDIEKIYSDKAVDSLDTMVYQIEGATAELSRYSAQFDASSIALKAFTIENYKSAKSVENLVSDLNEFSSALSKPGTQKYYQALEEISQSIVNMGWADSLKDAKKFFDDQYKNFKQLELGGESAQEAFEAISFAAAEAKSGEFSLTTEMTKAFNLAKDFNWEIGKAYDLTKEGQFKGLLNGSKEDIEALAQLYEIAGFAVTIDFNADDSIKNFLVKQTSVESAFGDNDEKDYWIESFDKYHNLLQDINAELRTRAKIEREINKMITARPDGTSLGSPKETFENVQAQIDSVNMSIALNEKLEKGRIDQLNQMNKLGEERGWDNLAKWDFDTNTVRINYDALADIMENKKWTPEQGQAFMSYYDFLKDKSDEIVDLRETIEDDNELKKELLAFGRDEYMELEKKVYDAIIEREKQLIDGMQSVSDSIGDANSELLSGLTKSINKLRQERQNDNTEKDIADKESRLAYLSQSTTSDPLEIMKLEEEIADARQSYTDQLIDQKISDLEEQNEQAKIQREKQIAIAQAQLDYNEKNGVYWSQTYDILSKGIDQNSGILSESELMKLLKSAEGWSAMSKEMQTSFLGTNQTLANAAGVYMNEGELKDRPMNADEALGQLKDIQDNFTNNKNSIDYMEIYKAIKAAFEGGEYVPGEEFGEIGKGRLYQKDKNLKWNNTIYDTAREYTLGKDGKWTRSSQDIKGTNGNTFNLKEYTENGGEYYGTKTITGYNDSNGNWIDRQATLYKIKVGDDYKWIIGDSVTTDAYQSSDKDAKNEYFQQMTTNNALVGKTVFGKQDANPRLFYFKDWWPSDRDGKMLEGSSSGALAKDENKTEWENTKNTGAVVKQAVVDKWGSVYVKLEGFKDWIHGNNIDWVRSNLDQQLQEVQNMEWKQYKTGGLADFTGPAWLDGTKSAPEIVLNAQDTKNFLQLRDILSDLFKGGNFERSSSSGDNYYDIDINVDEISNDYDVDQLAARIKQQIVSDSMYRNVNAINFIR